MLTLEQKKLKKKIEDNLVLHLGDVIETERKNPLKNETVPVYGLYSGHLDVNFKDNQVTIDYYLTDSKGKTFDAKDKTFYGPKELLAGGHIYTVRYKEIDRPVLATEKEKEKMYEDAKAAAKGKNKNYFG